MRRTSWFLLAIFMLLLLAGCARERSQNAPLTLPARPAHPQSTRLGSLHLLGSPHHTKRVGTHSASGSALDRADSIAQRPYEHAPCIVALVPFSLHPRPPPAMDCSVAESWGHSALYGWPVARRKTPHNLPKGCSQSLWLTREVTSACVPQEAPKTLTTLPYWLDEGVLPWRCFSSPHRWRFSEGAPYASHGYRPVRCAAGGRRQSAL